jgi:exonuclease 3'-5' domain-containing protein 1
MAADLFAARPIDAKTIQYCANDVVHLPDLHALYLRRIGGDWLAKAMEQSALRVAEARSPGQVRAAVGVEEAGAVGLGD